MPTAIPGRERREVAVEEVGAVGSGDAQAVARQRVLLDGVDLRDRPARDGVELVALLGDDVDAEVDTADRAGRAPGVAVVAGTLHRLGLERDGDRRAGRRRIHPAQAQGGGRGGVDLAGRREARERWTARTPLSVLEPNTPSAPPRSTTPAAASACLEGDDAGAVLVVDREAGGRRRGRCGRSRAAAAAGAGGGEAEQAAVRSSTTPVGPSRWPAGRRPTPPWCWRRRSRRRRGERPADPRDRLLQLGDQRPGRAELESDDRCRRGGRAAAGAAGAAVTRAAASAAASRRRRRRWPGGRCVAGTSPPPDACRRRRCRRPRRWAAGRRP